MLEAVFSKWKDILLRTFDIRMGESRRVWLMLLNVFLLIQCLWIVKPVVNAQFISRVGIDKLPLVFLLVALTALAFSRVYSNILHRLSLEKVMRRTYQFSIMCLIIFGVLLQFHWFADPMSYVFYIGVALFGLITTSQFWLQANMVFSSLEAKRLFGFIGAGAIAGGISGGYLTSLLTQFIDSVNLLYVAAFFLFISRMLSRKIWMEFLPEQENLSQPQKSKTLQEYPLRIIRNSKHLTYLASIIGISVVVAKLVEFQFSAIAAENIHDPDQLTAYFGFWLSTANAFALTIQLLLTQRTVGFLGVGRSLFILPGALILSTAAVLKAPVLWAGTTLKVLDVSIKQSIHKAATELLILPVPMSIKSQAKTYIDVFVDTTATGIGGLMLIFLINGMNLSVRAVSFLIIGLIILWIYFAIRARREYVLAFQRQLGMDVSPDDHKESVKSDASVAAGIRHTLRSGSIEKIIHVLQGIEESKDARLMNDVIPLLKHESADVRKAALDVVYYYPDNTITTEIEPLLKDPDDVVRSRAFSCLLAHTRQNRVSYINQYLIHEDPAINGAALIGLATETRANPKLQQQFNLEQRLQEKLDQVNAMLPEDAVDMKIIVVRAVGFGKVVSFYPLLIESMHDRNPAIARSAIFAAGNTRDLRFLYTLLSLLPDETKRAAAQKSLSKYNSSDILPILKDITSDPDAPIELLLQIPSLMKTMDTQQGVDFLFGLLLQHHHPSLKFETLEVLHAIKTKFPNLTFTGKRIMPYLMEEAELYKSTLALNYAAQQGYKGETESPEVSNARKELIDTLEQKLDSDLKRIFWLLGLSYSPNLILPLYKDLRKEDQDVRINTVELLDNILDPALKKVVISIVESAMLEKLSPEDFERMEVNLHSEFSCYELILEGKDQQLRVAVLKLIEAMKNPEFDKLVQVTME
ncbi:MAG: hypothetical protein ABIQ11_01880 [Saprospiraceae bacterium]